MKTSCYSKLPTYQSSMMLSSHLICVVALLLVWVQVSSGIKKMCPDNMLRCEEKNTCCPMRDNQHYLCCEFKNAVCCSDHVHCCPSGSSCDLVNQSCNAPSTSPLLLLLATIFRGQSINTPLVTLQPSAGPAADAPGRVLKKAAHLSSESLGYAMVDAALTNGTQLVLNPCPDHSVCPDLHTCCSFADGSYGCCPFQQGVCCSDHLTCCPADTTCYGQGSCRPN